MSRPAVFLDRDGTINEQMGYINHLSRFILLPGAADGIRLLNERRFRVIVVSNQSGVARGYFPIELVDQVHARMQALLEAKGAWVDDIFFCPHHERGVVNAFRQRCTCRKPRVGLIDRARDRYDIDMRRSYVVGDRCVDLEMAHRAGLAGILVRTGYGRGEMDYVLPHSPVQPARVAENLLEAARWIVEKREHA